MAYTRKTVKEKLTEIFKDIKTIESYISDYNDEYWEIRLFGDNKLYNTFNLFLREKNILVRVSNNGAVVKDSDVIRIYDSLSIIPYVELSSIATGTVNGEDILADYTVDYLEFRDFSGDLIAIVPYRARKPNQ